MQLESSFTLLGLKPDATIDDANRAYAEIHRKIDQFHKHPGTGNPGDRQEDIELLTCAYEKAVAYLSDREARELPEEAISSIPAADGAEKETRDLHFTINFPASVAEHEAPGADAALPTPNAQTIEEAISISLRRLHETEAALPEVQKAVDAAVASLDGANRRHDGAKQASLQALVAAKSAKTRALLLEIEAKRAMEEAMAVAKRAQERAETARQAADEARANAANAKDRVRRIKNSEETAAAEAVCAEDRLENEKARLKAMVHDLVEARKRVSMFQKTAAPVKGPSPKPSGVADRHRPDGFSLAAKADSAAQAQIAGELADIEAALRKNTKAQEAKSVTLETGADSRNTNAVGERRKFPRIVYPPGLGPAFSADGRAIQVMDLSAAGMRLATDDDVPRGIVRGTIDFRGQPPVKVTGKVVRTDSLGTGLRLVTRLGNQVLDRERSRLSA